MSSVLDSWPAFGGTGPEGRATVARFTVLLVDDDDAVRRVMARYLKRLGCSVIEAADGLRALRLAGPESGIDLVLSDIALPGMRGPALVSESRARWPSLPAVLMTGFAPEALHPEDWPPDTPLLTKPFTLQDLRLCLARRLGPGAHAAPCSTPGSDPNAPGGRPEDPTDGRRPS
jgi:CheY-like chemotaxis protein